MTWRACTVAALRDETPMARTIVLNVPDWPGHDAGQHVDVRLTAPDGYSAVRSYSIASAANDARTLELTVERIDDGEVSPYLTHELAVGDPLEIRGPIGGWFVWKTRQTAPVQLVAGGSGIVPLMAMIRTRANSENSAPFRLLYSVRGPDAILYRSELEERAAREPGLEVTYAYTRSTPDNWPRPASRIDAGLIDRSVWPSGDHAECYVCGPTPFVESAGALLIGAGYNSDTIRTERFGPTGDAK